MKKVLIIGNCGSGKSTFAKKLAAKTNLPLVHLDKLYWRGNRETVTRAEFDTYLQKELEKHEWIIDGNYNRTIGHRLDYCDTVFYFDLPTITCLKGVILRTYKNRGKVRDDMNENRPEKFDRMFFGLCKNVLRFNRKYRKYYYRLLDLSPKINKIIFKSREEADSFLEKIEKSV